MGFSDRRVFLFIPATLALLAAVIAGYFLMHRSLVRQTYFDVCGLVEDKFYLQDEKLSAWVKSCRLQARSFSSLASMQELIDQVQDLMDMMHVSHFMIYSPAEDRKLWKGESVETGLRARWMEDHAIIYQIIPNSPAAKAGFRIGDEVVAINGKEVTQTDQVSRKSGKFEIYRDREKQTISLLAAGITIDSHPTLRRWDKKTALIDLSSFRSEYFSDETWKPFVRQWKGYDRLIFDLRENAGGNFVAMLRALSPLFCQPTRIGQLAQPRRPTHESAALENDLSDDRQIDQLDQTAGISLETYDGYGCYRGSVAVLVGPHTASVSEIFAAAVSQRQRTRVFGQPTAGDVILAIWYDLPALGEGFSISIPQALFLTIKGENLEGKGVFPQQEVFDDLKLWRHGIDSWIQAAALAHF